MELAPGSKYDSLRLFVPEDLKKDFIDEFGDVGLHVGVVHCLSAQPDTIKGFLSVLLERGKLYAPFVLKALNMLQRKHSIRIEVETDRKLIDIKGLSTEDALKVIEAAKLIQVTYSKNAAVSATNSTHSSSDKTRG